MSAQPDTHPHESPAPSLADRVASLEKDVEVLTDIVVILLKTTGPEGNFRCYFDPNRFHNEVALEEHMKARAPSVHSLVAAKKNGALEGMKCH